MVKSFVASAETITGQHFDILASNAHLENGEFEALQHRIEDLEKEVGSSSLY